MNPFRFENATDPQTARRGAALLAVGTLGVVAALAFDIAAAGQETLTTVGVGIAAIVSLVGTVVFRRAYDF